MVVYKYYLLHKKHFSLRNIIMELIVLFVKRGFSGGIVVVIGYF